MFCSEVVRYVYNIEHSLCTVGAGGRESELIDSLKLILDRLNTGNIPITEAMVKRAQADGLISSKTGYSSTYTVHGGTHYYLLYTIQLFDILYTLLLSKYSDRL